MYDELADLRAALKIAEGKQVPAQAVVNGDNQAIQMNTGVLNAIQARLAGVTAQEANLAAQIASLSQDSSANAQMVSAYLEGEYEALQEQEIGLNASEAQYEQAIAAAQARLPVDQGVLNRINVQVQQLNQQISDLLLKLPQA